MSRKDLYRQDRCEVCRGFFYKDELRRDIAGRLVCSNCHFRQLATQRVRRRTFDIPMPWGVSLVEVIAVVLILGMLAGITIPSVMYFRQKALENELTQLFYGNQGTELGSLAERAISATRQGQSLRDIAELADVEPEELEQLEDSLKDCVGFDSNELQVGAGIKAITEWQEKVASQQLNLADDLMPSVSSSQ